MRRLLTSSAVGLAALTVLAEAPPSFAGRTAEPPPRPREPAVKAISSPAAKASPPAAKAPSAVKASPPAPKAPSAVKAPAPVRDRPAIRSVRVHPRTPVAGPKGAVKLVVEVVARGVTGPNGVTLRVEPGGRRRGRSSRPSAPSRLGGGTPRALGGPSPLAPRAAEGPVPVAGKDGGRWEMWRFNPPVGLTRWYPSGRWRAIATARNARGARVTASSSFLFKKATALSGVQVGRVRKRGRAVRLTGTLMRVDPTGRFDYWSFPRQRVTLQFRRHGQRTWKTVAKARTNGDGRFARRVKRAHGTWRVFYPGTPHYAHVSASSRHMARN
ncbi:hypothetical protein AB0O34_34015 [Sphaerisporangium sp. NPDC088356]|uniref:hypothetical protein n=1 Tax=Sphaerisporangium sp. NPDC088356 TaxID=3154871 RepID=UPI0034456538